MIYVVVIDASKLRDQDHRRLEEFLCMPEESNAAAEDRKAAEGNLIATKSNIADASFETVLKRIDQAVDELQTTTLRPVCRSCGRSGDTMTKKTANQLDLPQIVLPLQFSPRVPPHQPTRVTARAKEAIDIERILISGAATEKGAADWIVNDIEVDGRSQLTLKNLSGALFGGKGVAANQKARTRFSMQGFDPVEHGSEFTIVVTYVGPNPEGVPFFAAATGSPPPQRSTVVPIASKAPIPPTTKTTITARVQSAPFQVHRLEIADGDTCGGPADWLVADLRVNGRTQFAKPGPIPGDMFSTSAIDTFVKIEECEAGKAIEVDVIYIGLNERGARFTARLEGTVVRDDYGAAPPDLHVVVEVSGQGPGDAVLATCNWRGAGR